MPIFILLVLYFKRCCSLPTEIYGTTPDISPSPKHSYKHFPQTAFMEGDLCTKSFYRYDKEMCTYGRVTGNFLITAGYLPKAERFLSLWDGEKKRKSFQINECLTSISHMPFTKHAFPRNLLIKHSNLYNGTILSLLLCIKIYIPPVQISSCGVSTSKCSYQ